MLAANWAPAGTRREPDATLYVLARRAPWYALGGCGDRARWCSRADNVMVVFGSGTYRLVKVCVGGMCSGVSGDDIVFLHT